jgi:hypothetical protein
MVAAFDITQNPADHGSLTPMIEKTQEEFRKKDFTALAGKFLYSVSKSASENQRFTNKDACKDCRATRS